MLTTNTVIETIRVAACNVPNHSLLRLNFSLDSTFKYSICGQWIAKPFTLLRNRTVIEFSVKELACTRQDLWSLSIRSSFTHGQQKDFRFQCSVPVKSCNCKSSKSTVCVV